MMMSDLVEWWQGVFLVVVMVRRLRQTVQTVLFYLQE
jgi:hypothetical protein